MNSINIKLPNAEQLPSGRWRARVQVDDVRKSFIADTKDEAVRAAMLFRLQGSTDKDERKKALELLTFSEAIDAYISSKSNVLSPSTIKGYRSYQRNRIQSVMGRKLSESIDWQTVINDEADEVNAKTVKNIWGMVTAVLNANHIEYDDVTLPPLSKKEHLFLQPEEVKVFVSAIQGHRFEGAYLLCLHGLRRSEAFAIKKKDIVDGNIHVRGALVYDEHGNIVERIENKTYESARVVPVMIPRLEELAKECTTKYFCNYHMNSITHPLNTLCRQNGLPEVGLHGLRHSFASLCYHLKISEIQCMKLGGWSDINVMRKIYTHLAEIDKRNSETKLKDFFRDHP